MTMRWWVISVCGAMTVISVVTTSSVMVLFGNVPWTAGLTAAVVSAGLLLTVLALGLAFLVVRPIARRLYAIEEAASLIASGRLHHRIAVMGDDDEVGRLSEQFNRMGDTIEQQVRTLQQLAEENRRLTSEAEQTAALHERQRLARELHDSVSQQLFAMNMLAATAKRQFEAQSAATGHSLMQLADLANTAQREMRALLLQLRPVDLEGRSLNEAARAFLQAVEDRHQIRCGLEVTLTRSLGTGMEEQLFRILQEAVANVLKHAEATEIQVRIGDNGQIVTLSVLDDGKGIPAEAAPVTTAGYGLRVMQERAQLLGGHCEIWRRDRGTAIEVKIPVLEEDAADGDSVNRR